jgi:hypothetical protein
VVCIVEDPAGTGNTDAFRYQPIQKYAPQDCVGSLNAIIDNIDMIFATGNATLIYQMKSYFGLEDLKDNRDFAMTIAFPLGGPMNYPTNTWQELNWNSTYGSDDFWLFCTNVTNVEAPENITQLDYALAQYTGGEPWTNFGNCTYRRRPQSKADYRSLKRKSA